MDIVRRSIANGDKINIQRYLKEILDDKDEFVNKLGEAITMLMKYEASSDIVDNILSQWDFVDGDVDNSFITAAENFICTNDELRYLVRNSSVSDIRYMINQIMDNISFPQVINRLLYAYEDIMTNDDLLDLKEHLDMYESKTGEKYPSVMNYIERNMKLKAKKPDWVNLKDGENKSFLNNVSLGLDLESKDTFLKDLKNDMSKLKANVDLDSFVDMFSASISDVVDKDNSYDNSFRVWGPENRFSDRDCSGNPNSRGPCRMLRCLCRDAEENSGEVLDYWFTGRCDNCNRKIRDLSHAVRYPAKDGGWKGCYCSFYCVSQMPPYQTNKEDNVRLKNVKSRVEEIGIMDRSLM